MKCINHFITCSKPSLSSHISTKEEEHLSANTDSWQDRLKHDEKLVKKNLTNNVSHCL